MIISLVEIPPWLLSAGVVLCAAWCLSILLIVWLWYREWSCTVKVVVTGKIDGDTDKLVAVPVEVSK